MPDDLRREFHQQLDDIRDRITLLAASVAETIPRATQVLLDGDLEGADYLINGDDEIDTQVERARGALLRRARAAGADGERPAGRS